ncbi:MAG: HDOD domain-containing protein [Thermodesulfobacteriota bacterium]|nr:HDOD domain-containing protein [Thermodesulfobacteriota bacterium]
MEQGYNPEYTRQRILRALNKATDILTLPTVVQEIMDISSNKYSSLSDLTDVVERDPALTTKILSVANSPYYGFVKKVSTISHAVVVLGFQEIQHIVMSMSVVNLFDQRGSDFARGLWRHSFSVGVATRMVASYLNLKMDGRYFVAGLLHDVGKIFLFQYMPEQFNKLLVEMDKKENKLTYHRLEAEIYGISHAEIGGKLLTSWMFPSDIADAVLYHHSPENAKKDKSFAACIHIADILCTIRGISPLKDNFLLTVNREILPVVDGFKEDFSTEDMDELLSRLDLEIERQSSFVSAFRSSG